MELAQTTIEKPVNESELHFHAGQAAELAELELALVGGGIGNCELG